VRVKVPFIVEQIPERARKRIWSWDLYAFRQLNVGFHKVVIEWGYRWEGKMPTPGKLR